MTEQDNRKKLLIIIAWFFIPLIIAVSWYKLLPENYRPSSTTNNGQLLDPIFTLAPFEQQSVSGEFFGNQQIEKVWTLVQLIEGECDEACSRVLYNSRQLRISMGKDIDRLQRVVDLNDEGDSESNLKMWASHPDLTVLMANQGGIGAQIRQRVKNIKYGPNAVFLVDPLGNVMMYFAESLEPKLIKKDIRKLLKLSHIG